MKKIVGLLLGLAMACTAAGAACRSDAPTAGAADLSVLSPLFTVSDDEGHRTVTTLGTLKNASPTCLGDIVIEVKYFDAKQTLIDTVTQPVYGMVVPGEQEVAFRVRDDAARPKAEYASQSVRVVSADPRTGRPGKPQSASSPFVDFLIGWGPMLLLIGAWIFFMQRMKHKDSPQQRTIALIEQQNALFASQVQLLDRLAAAAEQSVPKPPAA